MDWPAHSPDLDPIEHVWGILYRRISQRDYPLMSIQKFKILSHEWETLILQLIQSKYDS